MLNDALQATDENGEEVFTTDVLSAVFVGNLKCPLHADDPRRPTWDSVGLKRCKKEGILSQFDQFQHLANYHKDEQKVINDHDQALRETEMRDEMVRDRAHREKTLTAMTDIAAAAAGQSAAARRSQAHHHFFAPRATSCSIFDCPEKPPAKAKAEAGAGK